MKVVQKCRTSVRKTRASVAQDANHSGDSNTTELPSEEIRLQVRWPKSSDTKAYQELEKEVLKKYKRLKKGSSTQERMEALSDTIYRYGSDTFDVLVRRPQEPKKFHPSRRSRKLTELRAQKKSLRKRWLNAKEGEKEGIKVLYEDIKARHRVAMRQERRIERKKQRRRSCQDFLKNPYGFAKQIFVESKSGKLKVANLLLKQEKGIYLRMLLSLYPQKNTHQLLEKKEQIQKKVNNFLNNQKKLQGKLKAIGKYSVENI